MRWKRVSDWAAVSDCGAYTVARIVVDGRDHFELWHVERDERGRITERQVLRRADVAKELLEALT